jgi:hypothetical protein
MKKTFLFLITAVMALSLFVSCGEDPFFHDVIVTDRDKVTTEIVFNGTDYTLPANSGEEFLGWKVDDDKYIKAPGEKVTITGETSIKAIYTDTEDDTICLLMYVLTSPDDNYSGSFSDSAKKKVLVPTDEVTLPNKDDLIEVEGATFDGWYTAADAEGNRKYYEGGEKITVTTFTKLYANWTDNNLEYVPSNGDSTATVKAATEAASYKVSAWSEGNKVTVVGDFTTAKAQLTTVSLPDTIKTISDYAFNECSKLTTCNLPSEIESIGNSAFNRCDITTTTGELVLPTSLKTLGTSAFAYNKNIKKVTISSTTESISENAFYECSSLESVTIGSGIVSMGNGIFIDCNKLTSITIQKSAEEIKKLGDWERRWSYDSSKYIETIKLYDASGAEVK